MSRPPEWRLYLFKPSLALSTFVEVTAGSLNFASGPGHHPVYILGMFAVKKVFQIVSLAWHSITTTQSYQFCKAEIRLESPGCISIYNMGLSEIADQAPNAIIRNKYFKYDS